MDDHDTGDGGVRVKGLITAVFGMAVTRSGNAGPRGANSTPLFCYSGLCGV